MGIVSPKSASSEIRIEAKSTTALTHKSSHPHTLFSRYPIASLSSLAFILNDCYTWARIAIGGPKWKTRASGCEQVASNIAWAAIKGFGHRVNVAVESLQISRTSSDTFYSALMKSLGKLDYCVISSNGKEYINNKERITVLTRFPCILDLRSSRAHSTTWTRKLE